MGSIVKTLLPREAEAVCAPVLLMVKLLDQLKSPTMLKFDIPLVPLYTLVYIRSVIFKVILHIGGTSRRRRVSLRWIETLKVPRINRKLVN